MVRAVQARKRVVPEESTREERSPDARAAARTHPVRLRRVARRELRRWSRATTVRVRRTVVLPESAADRHAKRTRRSVCSRATPTATGPGSFVLLRAGPGTG